MIYSLLWCLYERLFSANQTGHTFHFLSFSYFATLVVIYRVIMVAYFSFYFFPLVYFIFSYFLLSSLYLTLSPFFSSFCLLWLLMFASFLCSWIINSLLFPLLPSFCLLWLSCFPPFFAVGSSLRQMDRQTAWGLSSVRAEREGPRAASVGHRPR